MGAVAFYAVSRSNPRWRELAIGVRLEEVVAKKTKKSKK